MTETPDDTVLPCGCDLTFHVIDGKREMRVAPCREDCHYLGAMFRMAEKRKIPVTKRMI